MLYNALTKHASSSQADDLERARSVAADIAACLPRDFDSAKDIAIMLKVNLEDPKNSQLRSDVLHRVISPEVLVEMPEMDLVNPDIRNEREKGFQDRNRHKDWSELNKSRSQKSNLYKCKRCDSRDVNWELRQTRAGDEPMTVCCFCNQCHTSFRIYS
jgi:DNA-directed RNA polymerase subunit M/transcription elongation factor TFIIS